MNQTIDPPSLLLRLAAAQDGVLTAAQAAELGVGRHSIARLVRSGRWRRLGPSVFFVHDVDPPWIALVWAGVLRAGPAARVGGLAAARLHELCDDEPELITILVPRRQLTSRPPWDFHREHPGVRSPRSPGNPPRLTVEDTVLDLCTDPSATVQWVTAAVQRRRTSPARLREAVEGRAQLPHRRLLAELLADTREGAESPLEVRYLREVERAHGLPRGRRQVGRHGRRACHDVGYREFGLIVELDGLHGHEGAGRFRDMSRDNAALIDGYVTLRYGWADVTERPCEVAIQVADLLIRRGWTGLPSGCAHCRRVPR
ncbi:type IV toxin-antitoxin system AbiEi family antitoxin domain-containing protein [Microlunatus parietis]|uniref:Very-short-patch-repair endonuclease n=1 Tax=Microlunatus parietis TaxID=682979 RepID=A0A7Y9LD81_9ACTN|nr:type IV toxin-antitoxin system AbiEi family antitoxin domain-containing protein [Microlunatus parietis]NYE72495.1 very-short-patch-repair endonuclease [Microlunatus parietis]